MEWTRPRWALPRLLLLALLVAIGPACGGREQRLEPRSRTWAELRVVRRGVSVTAPGESARAPYPRERLVDGATVRVEPGGLVWLRRDAGATLLVRGPAEIGVGSSAIDIREGRIFVDAPPGATTELSTPTGGLHLAKVRTSIDVARGGAARAYVLAGELRTESGARAGAGEELVASGPGQVAVTRAVVWEDWTGGLATTDRVAEPAPFGVGTVGARKPGEQGTARFPLTIQRLDVRVEIVNDLAVTEVDQRFFNPSSEVVEGLYAFRTPLGATLTRFGVNRGDRLVWGRVKERAAAAAQYQSNVYEGSTEDPALLEWDAPGVYRARLYPIGPGESRRVVVRYSEWLGRTGSRGERRLYVYPMAAEGAEESLPHIEELTATIKLGMAGATEVRTGMAGVRTGNQLVIRAQDFVPRADLAIELFDFGVNKLTAYRAPHRLDAEVLAPPDREAAQKLAKAEADYLLLPLRAGDLPLAGGGLDLAIVVDSSAATEPGSLAIARAATAALLGHLGAEDRAVVWAGSEDLTPVVPSRSRPATVDAAARREILSRLVGIERGGASDLGALIASAAAALDPARRGAVVYVGDGVPTVGELSLGELRTRLGKLPRPVRIFSLGVGDAANMALLEGLSRGAFAERVSDAHSAAAASLRVLEQAERPTWLGAGIDLGPSIERVYPRDTGALVADETLFVVGRVVGKPPEAVTLSGPEGSRTVPIRVRNIDDEGDARRRWAAGRLGELLEKDDTGRAALVDVGSRYGIITPFTSLYVPTSRELEAEQPKYRQAEDEEREVVDKNADNKEGGTGTRAKGEEGSMGNPNSASMNKRYAVQGPSGDQHAARAEALKEAQEFGMIGLLNEPAGGEPAAPRAPGPAAPPARAIEDAPMEKKAEKPASDVSVQGNMWGDEVGESFGAGGLGLKGTGEGGGGADAKSGGGLGSIGTLGSGTGQGFGSGHGRLGGAHKTAAPTVRMGAVTVSGRLPPEVIQRIVRQNYGRFRMCYEQGLGRNPNLEGRISVRFVINREGAVSNVANGGSDLPDGRVVSCVVTAFQGLAFPVPEGGIVTVVYPVLFAPGGGGGGAAEPVAVRRSVLVRVDDVPRFAQRCSPAASVPLDQRIQLWRERLAKLTGNPNSVAVTYTNALAGCEAPHERERHILMSLLLDALPKISDQVMLRQKLVDQLGAADVIYRKILARIRTPEQRRDLNRALELKAMDPGALAKLLKAVTDPAQRVQKLRPLFVEWPDDFNVALALLDALEDNDDTVGCEELASQLLLRPDADARVRTAAGELFLRLAARSQKPSGKLWLEAAARRAFGEIVEFAADDPIARRRLGDLFRAHGWYPEARRQYETLARLVPDDTAVPLLTALVAERQGRLEEAVRWIEKTSTPGEEELARGASAAGRAMAIAFLAWGRKAALAAGRKAEADALAARARPLSAASTGGRTVRVIMSWAHPEFHPRLWSNALGTPMPAAGGDPLLGVAEVVLAERSDAAVEVRLEADDLEHAARLGQAATLTAIFDELSPRERIAVEEVRFSRDARPTLRFAVKDGSLTRE